jgi:hypothetical protein
MNNTTKSLFVAAIVAGLVGATNIVKADETAVPAAGADKAVNGCGGKNSCKGEKKGHKKGKKAVEKKAGEAAPEAK